MRRLSRTFPLLAALLLGAACAVLVACGGSGNGDDLIPDGQAAKMIDQLDTIQSAVSRGRCSGVGDDVDALQTQINNLSRRVDAGLRNRLQEGVNNLAGIAPEECLSRSQRQETQTQTTPTETTPTETTTTTTTTETVPTTTQTTPTVPPETTPTVPPETTPTVPPETVPPEGGATIPGDQGVGGATPDTGTP